MSEIDNNIKTFATRVRHLILSYKELKKENAELYSMVDERDKEIKELKNKLAEEKNRYDSLMTAKILNIGDDDIEMTRKRVNKLLRSVTQCITLLSEQK
ncbi:MAG: hypothetical protein KBT34_02250 [Prevotella sp.]|nr:hypothetical protein [Candidatus Prevotella equi]